MSRNVAKHPDAKSRRELLEQQKKAEQRADRRRLLMIVGAAAAVAVILIGAAIWAVQNSPENRDIASFGVSSSDAGASEIFEDENSAEGVSAHVGPQTNEPDVTTVEYETNPPSYGQHYPYWDQLYDRYFYGDRDAPQLEVLVHNLEHGYTVVWYDPDLSDDDKQILEDLSNRIGGDEPKFKAVPWDASRGEFDEAPDAKIAISHWGADRGYRQYFDEISGEAIQQFVDDHPATDAPEPNAA